MKKALVVIGALALVGSADAGQWVRAGVLRLGRVPARGPPGPGLFVW